VRKRRSKRSSEPPAITFVVAISAIFSACMIVFQVYLTMTLLQRLREGGELQRPPSGFERRWPGRAERGVAAGPLCALAAPRQACGAHGLAQTPGGIMPAGGAPWSLLPAAAEATDSEPGTNSQPT
jgi:hypothetical protein